MHQRLLEKGVSETKARLFVNWVDIEKFSIPSPRGVAAYRRELNIPEDAVVALYSGNMGGKQGIEVLFQVASLIYKKEISRSTFADSVFTHAEFIQTEIRVPKIVFVFCGNGPGRAELENCCHGLPNVRFLDLQPVDRLPDLMATADIHLLPQRADAADLVMPSKLTAMLASARPVIVTAQADTELANMVQTCGLVVLPEAPDAFANALLVLAGNAELRQRLGSLGHAYALAHLDLNSVLGEFEIQLKDLLLFHKP